jgi:hypothetical protein
VEGAMRKSYKRASSNRSTQNSKGHRKALEHIKEAKQLSDELGGTDEDVKAYLFSLPDMKLQEILKKYKTKYGDKAHDYARLTLPAWKSGKRHMSGLVAGRMYSLLPPMMPIETKYKLVESLWNHVGPSSQKTFYVGPSTQISDVSLTINEYLVTKVINYEIPKKIEKRFDWLSDGDVGTKQQLLNYFRGKEKKLAEEAMNTHLPVLLDHLESENSSFTKQLSHILEVGKHKVTISFSKEAEGISETPPKYSRPTYSSTSSSTDDNYGWLGWLLLVCFLFYLSS